MKTHQLARWEWLLIVTLLLLAFALRTHELANVPYGLHNDEVIETKTAESVAAGRLGIFFPEDTGAEGLHYYFAALFINIFGISAYALRLPAIFLSLISLCMVWALTRRLFGPVAALTALAMFAVTFWPVAFGRIISHTIMLVPVAALSVYWFWRAQQVEGRSAMGQLGLAGLFLGLSIYTYTAARILPVIFVAFGVYAVLAQRAAGRRWVKGIAVVLIVAGLLALPLAVVLAQNPALDALDFFDIDRPLRELQQGNWSPVIETSLRTLGMFAFFGDPLPYYDVPDRPVFEPIGALLLLSGLLVAMRRWRRPEYAFLLIWFGLSLIPGMLSQPAPNWTRTLGAQVVVFTLIGVGVAAWVQRFPGKVTLTALLLVFIGNLIWTAHDYFNVWPRVDTVRFWNHSGLRAVADAVQRDSATSPVVVCVPDNLVDERIPWWKPAWQHMRYLLPRPDVAVRYYNCVDTLIFPEGAARYAFPDAAADAVLQQFPIYTRFLASVPADRTELPDRLGVILNADLRAVLDQQLQAAVRLSVKLDGSPAAITLPINLDGRVEFLGYTLSQTGKDAELITYWRVKDQLPPQVSQFTHVLNERGEIVTQQDRLMLTSQSLRPGDVFAQIHHLTLPADLPPGSYPIAIGLYTQPDGKRLPIVVDQQPHGDRFFLEALNIP